MDNIKEHWEEIYQERSQDEMSWHQEKPKLSLELINELNINKESKIIDIGCGDSMFVDNLLALGFKSITLLDVSQTALKRVKERLGNKAECVKFILSDLREFESEDMYEIWHDRAVLHFLTKEGDIKKYRELAMKFIKPGGYLIVSTFSVKGPKKCSGLDVRQYSKEAMQELFREFECVKCCEEEHKTPWGANQSFIYSVMRKR